MPPSKLDLIYRSLLHSKFFTKGWGKPAHIQRLFEFRKVMCSRDSCYKLVSSDYKIHIDKEEIHADCRILDGHFSSPFVDYVPGVVPKESEIAYFQVILPKKWKSNLKPMCLHLAGTGDHFFWRRRTLTAKPLLKEAGIGSIILENPFYGMRKPKDQVRSSLHNVSDIFVMGGCLMLESLALFHWCEREGLGPLGVSGISMGGHMASLAAGVWPKPIALIPCLSWTTASCVFTQGVMSGAIPWHLLQNQYFSDDVYREKFQKMISLLTDDEAFVAGQHFAKTYPASLKHLKQVDDSQKLDINQEALHLSSFRSSNSNRSLPISLNSVGVSRSETHGHSGIHHPEVVTQMSPHIGHLHQDDQQLSNQESSFLMPRLSKLRLPDILPMAISIPRKNSPASTNTKESKKLPMEALQFMRGIMDEFTHLRNFAMPLDPSLVIVVAAEDDAYVLRDGIEDITELWPGTEVRYIDAGHITAFLFCQGVFRKSILDAFERLNDKYYREQEKKNNEVASAE